MMSIRVVMVSMIRALKIMIIDLNYKGVMKIKIRIRMSKMDGNSNNNIVIWYWL